MLLSVQTHIDTDNVIALDTRGNLFLHLTKESYQQLGLDGKPSIYKDKKRGPAKYGESFDRFYLVMIFIESSWVQRRSFDHLVQTKIGSF